MSSASPIDFATTLRDRLDADVDCDAQLADKLHGAYLTTKAKLVEQVYDNIAGAEPDLTDHGIRHVDNVLSNALRLLGNEGDQTLSGRELYCLGMSVLFHDAGNLYGRDGHRDRVSRLHDKIRGADKSLLHEKTLIVRAARAHTGKAMDGSSDTLKDVSNGEHLEGGLVRLQEVAALLRLADELAEGPQRTSELMQTQGGYAQASMKHHEYASSVHMWIDRAREGARLVMTFEIDLPEVKDRDRPLHWFQSLMRRVPPEALTTSGPARDSLKARLTYAYERIKKLDQERRYTSFYSTILRAFRSTEASFNFHHAGEIVEIELAPLKLTDIVLPSDPPREIASIDSAYDLDILIPRLIAATEKGRTTR